MSAERFQEADKYTAYLQTLAGKLRVDLGWRNLREFLPESGEGQRALDVGGGTGILALRLAEMGFAVELLDSCEAMLALARKEAHRKAHSGRISFRQGDANCLSVLFAPSSFDAVVCHNLLEYVRDPLTVLRGLAQLLKKNSQSVVSVLVRNRAGEVLKAAIKGQDLALAKAALGAETVLDSLYRQLVRVFDLVDLRSMVERAGLEIRAERGVRVVADYLDCGTLSEDAYGQLLEVESLLGAKPQFAAVARYTHIIARPSRKPASEKRT